MDNMEYEVGIDEAGRGPVIGPMVYACCAWPISLSYNYNQKGFKDSKKITRIQRENFYSELVSLEGVAFHAISVSSEEISVKMLSAKKISLNQISKDCAFELINKLLRDGIKVARVFVDTVGPAQSYENELASNFPGIDFTVRPKADSIFPVVSAASIVAKVTRDREIDDISREIGDVGCGYPSDPVAKAWLEEKLSIPFGYDLQYVRMSWETVKNKLKEKNIEVNWDHGHELNNKSTRDSTDQNKSFFLHEFLKLTD